MGIVIENPGILTTVQDEGRFGYQRVSGRADGCKVFSHCKYSGGK